MRGQRASRRTSAPGTSSTPSSTPGIWTRPPTIASSASAAHRDLHRPLALGDVVLGAGEADVGVLLLAGRRVGRHLGVGEVAVLELARLRARARRRTRGRSSGTCRCRSGTRRRSRAIPRTPKPPPRWSRKPRMSSFESQPENGGTPDSARPPIDEAANVNGIALRKPLIRSSDCVAAHRADHRAGRHEQQRLEERVRHQVEQARRVGADRDAHDHVADLGHRRVGDHALEVGLDERDRARDQQRQRSRRSRRRRRRSGPARTAGACARSGRRRRSPSSRRGSARRPASGPPSRPGARCGAGSGPTSRTRRRSSSRQPATRSVAVVREDVADGVERLRGSRRVPVWRKMKNVPEHEPDVADDVDHERLDARAGRRRAPVPEADQQVGGGADERPADDQQHEVAGQHQQQHREDEEVQVGEEARRSRGRASCR